MERQSLGPVLEDFKIAGSDNPLFLTVGRFKDSQSNFGQLPFGIVSEMDMLAAQDATDHFAILNLAFVQIPTGHFSGGRLRLEDALIQKLFLPFEDSALLQELLSKLLNFGFYAKEARDKRTDISADANQNIAGEIALPILLQFNG